ncbi:MAG: helix-turn-helix domain-containing protein [Anaerolineales bacterium]|nr:helix-turn-helix domain-containing protein [Anaerolineales bacterium]
MSDRQFGARLGALMQDARTVRGQTVEASAAALGLAPAQYGGYEAGTAAPSLPELELLAYFLDVPVSYFWGDQPLSAQPEAARRALPAADIAALRHRIIGIQLRQARQAAEQTPEALAASVGVTPAEWLAYEVEGAPVPLAVLSAAAAQLSLPLEHFVEARGPVGEWDVTQRALERVRQLPPELREFVSQPVNEHFLRLAQQLSAMPVDKLRSLATSLLEITY